MMGQTPRRPKPEALALMEERGVAAPCRRIGGLGTTARPVEAPMGQLSWDDRVADDVSFSRLRTRW